MIIAEGVSVPKEIDKLWDWMFVMSDVGLDTVAFIEEHYIAERGLSPEKVVDFLRASYLDKGKLGKKSHKSGLHPHLPHLLVLDVGFASPQLSLASGCVLELTADGKTQKVLAHSQSLPGAIDVDVEADGGAGRMFWTCMGAPGKNMGELFSARLDGSDIRRIVGRGIVNTPKQLVVEPTTRKIYFTDREGMRVLRANYDGSELETLVQTGDWITEGSEDQTKWCVGIAVSPKLGKFYWTQKGFSKAGKGRIFCDDIATPSGPGPRTDIQLVQDKLPQPIDLEIDESTDTLYRTDRRELLFGNSVNCARLDPATVLIALAEGRPAYEMIVRRLNEAVGLKLDNIENGHMYLTDFAVVKNVVENGPAGGARAH